MKPSEKKQKLVEELIFLYEKITAERLYGFPRQKDTQDWLAEVASIFKNLDESDYQEVIRLSKTITPTENRENRKRAAYEIYNFVRRKIAEYKKYDFSYLDREIREYPEDLTDYIHDKELRDRCLDLLKLNSKFDRVINQATQVFEDRIRTKAGLVERTQGVELVNKVLNTDLSKTILKISDNPDEHEGFCHISRGLMLTFRNPSHHYLTDVVTREEALKLCGFIDALLSLLEKAKIINSNYNL